MKLSECHLKLGSKHEAGSTLVDAANAYKKTNKKGAWRRGARPAGLTPAPPAESAACLSKAAEYFKELGRLSVAAKHFKARGGRGGAAGRG